MRLHCTAAAAAADDDDDDDDDEVDEGDYGYDGHTVGQHVDHHIPNVIAYSPHCNVFTLDFVVLIPCAADYSRGDIILCDTCLKLYKDMISHALNVQYV